MPGALRVGPPAARPAQRLRERRRRGARGAGCTTTPGRLVDDQQVLVLADDLRGRGAGSAAAPAPASLVDLDHARPPRRRWLLARGCAVDQHRARRRSAAAAARARAPRAARRGRRRAARPASSAAAVSSALRHRALRRQQHQSEQQHADDDRDVGDVEGRPQRRVDEVDHRARSRTRSTRLPSAPPSSSPIGSHSQRARRVWRRSSTSSAASATSDQRPARAPPPPSSSAERDAACCARCARSSPKTTSTRLAGLDARRRRAPS